MFGKAQTAYSDEISSGFLSNLEKIYKRESFYKSGVKENRLLAPAKSKPREEDSQNHEGRPNMASWFLTYYRTSSRISGVMSRLVSKNGKQHLIRGKPIRIVQHLEITFQRSNWLFLGSLLAKRGKI